MKGDFFNYKYFITNTYKNVSFAKYSQYWWSNRFYSALARRYGNINLPFLEIGCGLGHLVGQMENYFSTFGVDINFWAVKQAALVAKKTRLSKASAEHMPFGDNFFGVVIIKHVVEHLPHPESAVMEIARILRPGGLLILSTPNLDSLLKPLKGNNWVGYLDPTHISLKTPEKWLEIITKFAGLKVSKIISDGFWDAPYIPIIPNIIQKFLFGFFGGVQAISTIPFIPKSFGESILIFARKPITPI